MDKRKALKVPAIAVAKWRAIADLLAELARVPAATINILDEEDSLRVIGGARGEDGPGSPDPRIDLGLKTYCSAVINSREPLTVADAARSAFWKDSEGAKAGYIAYSGVPIFRPDQEIFGSICLFDRKPNDFAGPIQKVMKEFSEIITDHLELIQANIKLEESLKEVRTLQGLIPICAQCKKIRDDKGYWEKVETYLEKRSQAKFTHGLCEECMEKLYGHETWFKDKHQGSGNGKAGK